MRFGIPAKRRATEGRHWVLSYEPKREDAFEALSNKKATGLQNERPRPSCTGSDGEFLVGPPLHLCRFSGPLSRVPDRVTDQDLDLENKSPLGGHAGEVRELSIGQVLMNWTASVGEDRCW